MRPFLVSPLRGNLQKIVVDLVVVNPSGILPGRSLTIWQRKELYLHKRRRFLVEAKISLYASLEDERSISLQRPVRMHEQDGSGA